MLRQVGEPVSESDFTAAAFKAPDFDALERALDYFAENFDEDEYPDGAAFAESLAALRQRAAELDPDDADAGAALRAEFDALQKKALLANPELDFDSALFVRRNPQALGLPENYNSNSVLPQTGYRDELARLNLRSGETTVVYKPANGEFVGDLELYYDASKIMFSSPNLDVKRWRVWELSLDADGAAAGEPIILPQIIAPDVDNYDACYLPDDRIIFCSTACQTGVPCIDGSGHVCNLYIKEKDDSIRQLTIEQDHDWNPVVLGNGRVMYLRWEYVDLPHAFSRIIFHMNPDGTNQSELYGSGSYWPTALFGARPLPGSSTKFVGIATGHHELHRQGDLVLFAN
ncbi:MAG: hypothetical protein HUK22_07885, partial [Thermoguttaceae bacterium]|nr:hypothetical protein [Thermoguttaceae bacterium]